MDIVSINPYYLPDEVYGVILNHFLKFNDVRDLILLGTVSKLFKNIITVFLVRIDVFFIIN